MTPETLKSIFEMNDNQAVKMLHKATGATHTMWLTKGRKRAKVFTGYRMVKLPLSIVCDWYLSPDESREQQRELTARLERAFNILGVATKRDAVPGIKTLMGKVEVKAAPANEFYIKRDSGVFFLGGRVVAQLYLASILLPTEEDSDE